MRRGSLLVIPIGRALLYAEPIYLQAERSPMPELRLVVLALQDRLAYGPTFEAALAGSVRQRPVDARDGCRTRRRHRARRQPRPPEVGAQRLVTAGGRYNASSATPRAISPTTSA